MLKKTVSILLSMILLFSLALQSYGFVSSTGTVPFHTTVNLTQENEEQDDTPLTGYAAEIQEVLDAYDRNSKYHWYCGALYDLNGDHIDELLLLHYITVPYGEQALPISYTAYSIYTQKDGNAIPIIENEPFYCEAGGPSGHIYVARKDSRTYLLLHNDEGNYGDYILMEGDWIQYSFDGQTLHTHTTASYEQATDYDDNGNWFTFYDMSSAVINGVQTGYDKLEDWIAGFEILGSMGNYYNDIALPLPALLEIVKWDPNAPPAIISTDHPNFSLPKGDVINLSITHNDGKAFSEDLSTITVEFQDPSILKTLTITPENDRLIVELEGLAMGTTNVTVRDSFSGYDATFPITVTDQTGLWHTISTYNNYQTENYPTPLYNANGLYIESFDYDIDADGIKTVSFTAYNSNYSYAVVESYDIDGNLVDAAIIDKMDLDHNAFKETIRDGNGFSVRNLWKNTFTYRTSKEFTKSSAVEITFPEGGTLKISTAPTQSIPAGFVNGADCLMSAYSVGKGLQHYAQDSYAFVNALLENLLQDPDTASLLSEGSDANETLWKNMTWETLITAESMTRFTNTIAENIEASNLSKILFDTIAAFGYEIQEMQQLTEVTAPAFANLFEKENPGALLIQVNDLMLAFGTIIASYQEQENITQPTPEETEPITEETPEETTEETVEETTEQTTEEITTSTESATEEPATDSNIGTYLIIGLAITAIIVAALFVLIKKRKK